MNLFKKALVATAVVASFGASFIPGAQGFALISGTLGMMGFALDKQFCS